MSAARERLDRRGWLGEPWHALEPQAKRLPVNTRDDCGGHPAIAHDDPAPAARRAIAGFAVDPGFQHRRGFGDIVEVVDAGEPATRAEMKSKAIVPTHLAEWRDVE